MVIEDLSLEIRALVGDAIFTGKPEKFIEAVNKLSTDYENGLDISKLISYPNGWYVREARGYNKYWLGLCISLKTGQNLAFKVQNNLLKLGDPIGKDPRQFKMRPNGEIIRYVCEKDYFVLYQKTKKRRSK
ncbi:hypothetical protein HN777_04900 [Candidatus Woesearchaeota archaeon]|jgi:hypothetical protein|nr:hypothetical protein [Candidatus Woesearchaeota archaeon]MBT7403099.1 hypothetical protein [Candidatus Woesearchaeota archaeon]